MGDYFRNINKLKEELDEQASLANDENFSELIHETQRLLNWQAKIVDAVAKRLFRQDNSKENWNDLSEDSKDDYRRNAMLDIQTVLGA